MQNKSPRIPQHLSDPLQILWFQPDDIGICVLSFIVASIFKGFFWLLIIVGPVIYIWAKLKYPSSFLKHMLYFVGKDLKYYPSSFYKKFNE